MEAPIPASALIHSATLVSAGIFLCLYFFDHIVKYNFLLQLLSICGILSAVVFSIISSLQTDVKRLLAYSTIANCGFVYFLIGNSLYFESIIYFILHGILKSYLFLIFGFIVHESYHYQDMQIWIKSYLNRVLLFSSIILFTLLGGLNLTFIYDTKHNFLQVFKVEGIVPSMILELLLFIYVFFSFSYGTKYILLCNAKNKLLIPQRTKAKDDEDLSLRKHFELLF